MFCVPIMAAAKSTVAYLRNVIPGQTDAWYDRIASEILAGRMPLPRIEVEPLPERPPLTINLIQERPAPETEVEPALLPNAINPARQRYLDSNDRPAPSTKPKSKTKQLKQGTYQAPRSKANLPDTAGAAIRQAQTAKPKAKRQPASATTKWKLENLVRGDKGAAARLAAKVAFDHPDKSEQWCWEKAIFDLTRDRH